MGKRTDAHVEIYFHLIADDDKYTRPRIKIGKTRNGAVRKGQHESSPLGANIYLEHLCTLYGKDQDESNLHSFFKKHRWPNQVEVYKPVDAIIEYIR